MDGNFEWLREDLRAIRDGQAEMLAKSSAFHERLDNHAATIKEHDTDIKVLQATQQEQAGVIKGVRWMWAVIAAILAFFGIHIGVSK